MAGHAIGTAELEARLSYHKMETAQLAQSESVRNAAKYLASVVTGNAPPGRETSLAITHVEEALMWANKAIARGEA
jgi:uncharacterized protein with PhoU and TrkA domain